MQLNIRPVAAPSLTGVTATPGVQTVVLKWDTPADATYAGAEVWCGSTTSVAAASKIGTVAGNAFTHTGAGVGTTSDRYYWVRAVNIYGRADGAWSAMQTARSLPLAIDVAAPGTVNSDIVVGGRNLYAKTSPLTVLSGACTVGARTASGFSFAGIVANTGSIRLGNVIPKNGTFTISFDLVVDISNGFPLTLDFCDGESWTLDPTTTVQHFSHTFSVSNYSGSTYNFVDFNGLSGQNYTFTNFKVEDGNKATAWTPSPDDVQAGIDTAQAAANTANAAIAIISSDSVLSKGEKIATRKEYEAIDAEWATLIVQADALGVDRSEYNNAHQALSSYLVSLGSSSSEWQDSSKDTTIDGSVFRQKFTDCYNTKQKLINALAAKAATTANSDGSIRTPGGGYSSSTNSYSAGALKIRLPQSWTNTMMKFTVDIYEYVTGYSCTLDISGYNYVDGAMPSGGSWYNVTARVVGGSNVEYPVYFGHDGTKCCVWIGNAGESWAYPQVRVRDFLAGYSGTSKTLWENGWQISFDNVAATYVTGSVLDTMPGADWSKSSKRPANLAALSGSEAIQNSTISIGANGALSGAGGGQVTLPGMGQNMFRAVSAGGSNATATASLGLYKNGTLVGGLARSYSVYTINRSTGAVAGPYAYDVYGAASQATDMANKLNSLGNDVVVAVITADEPQANRLSNGLDTAMYRCGASRAVYGSSQFQYRAGYVLIGIPGCGEGNGAEGYQGAVSSDANSWVDMSFNLINGAISGVSNAYTPRSLTDYGYTGDLNASADITLVGRGVTVSGNTLTKWGSAAAWDADAYSTSAYTGGAYAEVKLPEVWSSKMFGLNDDTTTDASYTSLNYAWYCEGAALYAFSNGSNISGLVGYAGVGDILAVTYDGVNTRFLKNGVVMFTMAAPANQQLYFDSSFNSPGASYTNVRFGPMSSNNWADTGGTGRPADNATVGAPAGTSVGGMPVVSGGALQSSNYVAGSTGYSLKPDGSAEFGAIAVRGEIKGSSIKTSVLALESARMINEYTRLGPFSVYDCGMQMSSTVASMTVQLASLRGASAGNDNEYLSRRVMRFKCDFFLKATVTGDGGVEQVYIEVQYNTNGYSVIASPSMDLTGKSSVTVAIRYTSIDSWYDTLDFRARTVNGKTLALTFEVQAFSFNTSPYAGHSNSGIASTPPPPPPPQPPETWCVDYETTLLSSGLFVRDSLVGDLIEVWNDDAVNPEIEMLPLRAIALGYEQSYLLRTASGAQIIQSKSTPMSLRDGRVVTTDLMLGEDVLVNRKGSLAWEPVIALEDAGVRKVVKVNLGDRMYFAGMQSDATIATHNMQYKQ